MKHILVNNIVKIQYPFGDHSISEMIYHSINAHPPSHEAVTLLSELFGRRDQTCFSVPDAEDRISKLQPALSRAQSEDRLSADDGITALHIALYYFLVGGRGRWNEFLMFACHYARKVLENPSFMYHYPTALEAATPKDQFVVKTAIWFDVLASITTRTPPQLLSYIRALFKPDNSLSGMPTTCSMMPMGCENTVVWALAETSDLSCWKHRGEQNGDLSVDELVRRVREIEPYLADPILPIRQHENFSWFLASEIFRTSTKLFLKSVELGDFPHVQEIRDSVFETIDAIQDFLKGIGGSGGFRTDNHCRSVMHRTRICSYICGSLTDNRGVRKELTTYLELNMGHEDSDLMHLLAEVHDTMQVIGPRRPAPWRRQLMQTGIVLI